MPDALKKLARIVTDADAPDGWKVRTKETVRFLEDDLGLPLARNLAGSGLTLQNRHQHESKPDEDAQFVFWEPFELPAQRLASVHRFLQRTSATGTVKQTDPGSAYLALVVGHRWEVAGNRAGKRSGYEGHVRWGFFFEASEKRTDTARPVLSGGKIVERVLRFGGTDQIAYLSKRPLPGFNQRNGPVGQWLSGLGRSLNAAQLGSFASLDTLRVTIANDLITLHRTLSDET